MAIQLCMMRMRMVQLSICRPTAAASRGIIYILVEGGLAGAIGVEWRHGRVVAEGAGGGGGWVPKEIEVWSTGRSSGGGYVVGTSSSRCSLLRFP